MALPHSASRKNPLLATFRLPSLTPPTHSSSHKAGGPIQVGFREQYGSRSVKVQLVEVQCGPLQRPNWGWGRVLRLPFEAVCARAVRTGDPGYALMREPEGRTVARPTLKRPAGKAPFRLVLMRQGESKQEGTRGVGLP